jgi:methionyl-tRNA formyltransferase
MRFAITATDRYLGVFETLVRAGWQPLRLFTAPVDDRLFHNRATIDYAQQLQIPIQLSPLTARDLEGLRALDCDILVVASYNQKIVDWSPYLRYAVNFHPSPLPVGRGPYPLIKAVRDRHTSWGVSCHKLSQDFDAGDILACERFVLSATESHETLDLKVQMAAKRLAGRVAANFEALWDAAQPQIGGSYWKFWSEDEKTIDFGQGVDSILLQSRSFGAHETFADLKGFRLRVKRAIGWTETHAFAPGTPVHAYNNVVVIAARDGFVALTEWTPEGSTAPAMQALNA